MAIDMLWRLGEVLQGDVEQTTLEFVPSVADCPLLLKLIKVKKE